MFKLKKQSKKSKARLGVLKTAKGEVRTPFFMPIATKAAIKSLEAKEVKDLGAEIILSNTYHNLLKPGTEVIKKFGGLHKFMDNDLPILTDSGGYQVFSLAKFRKIKGNNIEFQSHIDGSRHVLNPKKVINIQVALNSDIMMVLDECVGLPTTKAKATEALERTSQWAKLAIDYKNKLNKKNSKIKKQLVDLEITEIRETMKNLTDEPRVHQIPNYPIPRTIPNPLTPTCSTGKQLLTDSKDNFGDVNG